MKDRLKDGLQYLTDKGVDYADFRHVRAERESIKVKNGRVETISRGTDEGFGLRVVAKGAWGFACSSALSADEVRKVCDRAIEIAHASAMAKEKDVRMAEVEPAADEFRSPCEKDPFQVSLEDKIRLLTDASNILMKDPRVKVSEGTMRLLRRRQTFLSTEDADIDQEILSSGAGIIATVIEGAQVQRRSFPSSFGGDHATRGYEFVEGLKLVENAERVREEAVQLLSADPCPSKRTTIILGGSQLALQVHESCGHPIELDRALGSEISFAGGSFLSLDKRGSFRYGSKLVNITADATIEGGLATFGYDDEGVRAQKVPIVREGIFVGYLTSREAAVVLDQKSNGTMRADGWDRTPLIRMTNVNLEPGEGTLEELIAGTEDGVFLDTNKTWSIDDMRLNFQFGTEIAWEIKKGKLTRMLKDPIYTGITPEFWNSCDAICGESDWRLWGVPNCGKGEPAQTARVGHGVAPARFRNVEVGVRK